MESYFDKQAKYLYNKAEEIINTYAMLKANKKGENFDIDIPQDFKNEFFKRVTYVYAKSYRLNKIARHLNINA